MTDYLPQQTIQYKTFLKNTMVSALRGVFQNHPDKLLQDTHVSIEYPRDAADYPTVIVRFFERDISTAGIGHVEKLQIDGETGGSSELDVDVRGPDSAVRLTWDSVAGATKYRVYRASSPGIFDSYVESFATEYKDTGSKTGRVSAPLPTINNAPFENPQNLTGGGTTGGFLQPNTYRYRVTAVAPSQVWKFEHSFYTGDIEFAIYGLSSVDRDLVADTIVQTLRFGDLEAYTNRFFAQVFADTFPDNTNVHILTFNRDLIQGFGENQAPVPWQQTDSYIYTTAYRCRVWGEFYNVPPKIPFALIEKYILYPFLDGLEPVPTGDPNNDLPWE